MGCAEVIALPEVRARTQWEALRQQLHERFARWLDEVEAQLPASAPTLAPVSETIWTLRQQLTGGVAQTAGLLSNLAIAFCLCYEATRAC